MIFVFIEFKGKSLSKKMRGSFVFQLMDKKF
jgi:hypothetical protein